MYPATPIVTTIKLVTTKIMMKMDMVPVVHLSCGILDNTDCDDSEYFVNPGATEVCDFLDNDCNGLTDEGVTLTLYADSDGDGYGNPSIFIETCTPYWWICF